MRERPILFCGDMVRAILAGTKKQTRLVMRLQPSCAPELRIDPKWGVVAEWPGESEFDGFDCHCPYGQPGDRLWVRETFRPYRWPGQCKVRFEYLADGAVANLEPPHDRGYVLSPDDPPLNGDQNPRRWIPCGKRPSIHMPRWASRITLEVTDVRVQRVQEISEEDAKAEGIDRDKWGVEFYAPGVVYTNCYGDKMPGVKPYHKAAEAYRDLWNEINAKRGFGWDENPWVWAVTFRRTANG